MSSSTVKPKVYHSVKKSVVCNNSLVHHKEKRSWDMVPMVVPNIALSRQIGCNIIDVKYSVVVSIDRDTTEVNLVDIDSYFEKNKLNIIEIFFDHPSSFLRSTRTPPVI